MRNAVTNTHATEHKDPIETISVTIDEAVRCTGIGRSTLYQAIASGDLPSFKNGKRRLFLYEDLKGWVRQIAKGAHQ